MRHRHLETLSNSIYTLSLLCHRLKLAEMMNSMKNDMSLSLSYIIIPSAIEALHLKIALSTTRNTFSWTKNMAVNVAD